MSADWSPLILAGAPNGAYKGPRDHPALPVTVDEIARTAVQCREAGASMIHLHARDAQGNHSVVRQNIFIINTSSIPLRLGAFALGVVLVYADNSLGHQLVELLTRITQQILQDGTCVLTEMGCGLCR